MQDGTNKPPTHQIWHECFHEARRDALVVGIFIGPGPSATSALSVATTEQAGGPYGTEFAISQRSARPYQNGSMEDPAGQS